MTIDCGLSQLVIPGFPEMIPEFGTKKADGVSSTAREATINAMLPFARQRPFPVTEDSDTSEVQSHTSFVIQTGGVTLTLGDGGFVGCVARVFNRSGGDAAVIYDAGAGSAILADDENLSLEWSGVMWKEVSSGGGSSGGRDLTGVVNNPWYNPGTALGGISWTDPTFEFDYIEIFDTLAGNVSVAQIAPGVQFWQPEPGTRRYHIRAKRPSGSYSAGALLDETTYAINYKANLVSVTIPMAAANQVVLEFDNFVKLTDTAGFSITGISDSLELLARPDAKTIVLKLSSTFFSQGGSYSLSYDPAVGNTLQNDDNPIDPVAGHAVDNYADYSPAQFVSAQIPQAEPGTLVLVMSRPVTITDVSAFTLAGTTAVISAIVSEGTTAAFALSEPVDHSSVESAITLSYNGAGAIDTAGQNVASFSNRPVTNNSTNQAITVQAAEIPANDSRKLIVVMRGAVTMASALGFQLTSADQSGLPDLAQSPYSISGGTITFTLSAALLAGKSFTVSYNGSGSLKAADNNDTIRAFSLAAVNNSTDTGGIGPGVSARNLAIVVLGREADTPADVTEILTKVHETIAAGNVGNFALGDYFYPVISPAYPFVVPAGYDSGGGINLTANADLGEHGKHIGYRIVSKNGHLGKNGITWDHVIFHSMNVFGYTNEADANGHYMNASDTNAGGYLGCQMRQYLLNSVLPAMEAQGIPFSEEWIKAIPRNVSRGGTSGNPGADSITDKLFLPTEYEMFGGYTYSNQNAEASGGQGRWEYYDGNEKRIKYNKDNSVRAYWEASPYSGYSNYFCDVNTGGGADTGGAYGALGCAPAFCVA